MPNKKRKKLRVAFRKNRQKRTRKTDITREVRDEGAEETDVASQRLGKDELSRYRTIMGVESGSGGAMVRDVDESQCLAGRVVSAVGLTSLVQVAGGRRYECTIRRVVRTLARDERNAVVTGDEVLFQPVDERTGVIERVNPRRKVLSRATQRREHIIVANVDQALIVVSAAEPPLKTSLIDRLLISAEKGGVHSVICINKVDLVDPLRLQPIVGIYGRLGYDVVLTSAPESAGIERLRSLLKNRETVVAGQSGVGKSSLLNALQPDLALHTAEVSSWTTKGRHTTRRAILLQLASGGWVADTPGIRQFELWDVIPEEVEGFFVEFRPFVTLCKFPDCSHTHEDGCGVKTAVENDLISPMRYESYLRIVEGD